MTLSMELLSSTPPELSAWAQPAAQPEGAGNYGDPEFVTMLAVGSRDSVQTYDENRVLVDRKLLRVLMGRCKSYRQVVQTVRELRRINKIQRNNVEMLQAAALKSTKLYELMMQRFEAMKKSAEQAQEIVQKQRVLLTQEASRKADLETALFMEKQKNGGVKVDEAQLKKLKYQVRRLSRREGHLQIEVGTWQEKCAELEKLVASSQKYTECVESERQIKLAGSTGREDCLMDMWTPSPSINSEFDGHRARTSVDLTSPVKAVEDQHNSSSDSLIEVCSTDSESTDDDDDASQHNEDAAESVASQHNKDEDMAESDDRIEVNDSYDDFNDDFNEFEQANANTCGSSTPDPIEVEAASNEVAASPKSDPQATCVKKRHIGSLFELSNEEDAAATPKPYSQPTHVKKHNIGSIFDLSDDEDVAASPKPNPQPTSIKKGNIGSIFDISDDEDDPIVSSQSTLVPEAALSMPCFEFSHEETCTEVKHSEGTVMPGSDADDSNLWDLGLPAYIKKDVLCQAMLSPMSPDADT